MPNYFLRLAYDGTRYRGYQWQPGGLLTVQSALEETLSQIHKTKIVFSGCGRTDSGVHASQYYGHLRTPEDIPVNYLFILNKQLPKGIVVHDCFPVRDKAHARFDAFERTYDYFFQARPDAFHQRFSSLLPLPDFAPALSAQLIKSFVGKHDFRAFCKSPDQHNTTFCTFEKVELFVNETGDVYRLRFVANRFLRGMIRIIARDIIDVGLGKRTEAGVLGWVANKERPQVIKLAPPEGLFLTGVRYQYADREPDLPSVHAGAWRLID